MSGTKICKNCNAEIPKNAKYCPNCRQKQGGKLKIIIGVIVVLLILGAFSGKKNTTEKKAEPDSSASSVSTTTEEAKAPEAPAEEIKEDASSEEKGSGIVQIGGSYEGEGLKFTVNDAEIGYKFKDKFGMYKLDEGMTYVMVDFTFENTGKSDRYVSIYDFKCYADNTACEQKFVTDVTGDFINTNLSSGRNISFKTLYAVPENANAIELEYEANIWTDEKIVVQIK